MDELMTIQVNLPKNKLNNIDLTNKRFVKMGYQRLESIKRESLPVIQNSSILKRYKTDRSQQKFHYVNQFEEFTNNQCMHSNHSMKSKRQVQPLSLYKKPKIKDCFLFFRKKLLPKVKSIKKSEEVCLKLSYDKKESLNQSSIKVTNQSFLSFDQNQLITFYPNKLQQNKQ